MLSCVGFLNFQWEANAIKLWIPNESDFARNYAYLWDNYPPDMRFHSLLFGTENDENILEPKYIQKMYRTYKKIVEIQTPTNLTWNDLCFRLPIVDVDASDFLGYKNRERRGPDQDFDYFENVGFDELDKDSFIKAYDPSVELYPEPYCGVVEGN